MFKKIYFDTLLSTNKYLKENYHKYSDHTVIICHNQTNGYGRFNRAWEMKTNDSIAMSILLKPNKAIEGVSRISLLTSAAIFKVISSFTDKVKLKWPNDVLVNGKKISGILLESIISNDLEALIIGIGVNVNNDNFSCEVTRKATSLKIETNETIDLEIIIDEILKWFDYYYKLFLEDKHSYIDLCRKNSSVIGDRYLINGRVITVLDILDNGNILVKDGNDNIEYSYGELTLEEIY